MTGEPGDRWYGYAPVTVSSHKYVVAHHPRVGFRVAVRVPERSQNRQLTLFSPEPWPAIESQIRDGGPFLVNEWKQVLKPRTGQDGYREAVYLGEIPDLHFVFRYRDRVFDNADDAGLRAGDRWPHQETGIPYRYNLRDGTVSRDTQRWEEFALVEETETLSRPAEKLLDGLRRARPREQAGRLYVNEHGVVFTPDPGDELVMRYVCRIDVNEDPWFPKHEC
jgi:hypothetical protein